MNETGKISEGKVSYKEIEWDFIEAMAKRLNEYKKDYPVFSWQSVEDLEEVEDAIFRHWKKIKRPESGDPENREDHLTAIALNAQILFWHLKNKK